MDENYESFSPRVGKRIGYWVTERKFRRLNFETLEQVCRNAGLELFKLDFNQLLDDQGPIDVIVHKLTDHINRSLGDSQEALKWMEMVQSYVKLHPEVIVIDPVESVMRLQNRRQQYEYVSRSDVVSNYPYCFVPAFVELTSSNLEENRRLIIERGITFPLVSKPQNVAGHLEVEKMAIIFNEAGLADIDPPCVVQSFVNHNARLFKIFIIGPRHFVVQRPSIRNCYPGGEKTIFFNSCDVSKSYSLSDLNMMTESEVEYPIIEPDEQKLLQLSAGVQKQFHLELVGIDMIIDNRTGRYAVIDVNVFPGYDGIPEFVPAMLELIQSKVAGSRVTGSGKNLVKLEKASAFYLPPICEIKNGNDAQPAVKAELQSKKAAAFADDCMKLTNGSPTSSLLYNDAANCIEPFVTLFAGNSFKSYHSNDVNNGSA